MISDGRGGRFGFINQSHCLVVGAVKPAEMFLQDDTVRLSPGILEILVFACWMIFQITNAISTIAEF